jgi:aspartyl-tRNA(Asn)/glutamyl-tRNA(Gln) amidotransferase subunit C
MKINQDLVTYLEDSSYLSFSDGEKVALAGELEGILSHLQAISTLDVPQDTPECVLPCDIVNIFRNDEVKPSFERELILKNAAESNDTAIIAPRIME